jgi:adenylate cyclase
LCYLNLLTLVIHYIYHMTRNRQLVAIMFTDIHGYTAMLKHDEGLALKIRERHRKIFNSATKKFDGKILQYFGDGTLSIFTSTVDAVKCAIEMQKEFQKEPVIPVRIGIHSGDIIHSENEIIGDSVNVASRIEEIAIPGSIFISDKVYDEVKNQSSIETRSLKTFELKNVDKPIEVFAISNKGLVFPGLDKVNDESITKKHKSKNTQGKKINKKKKQKHKWLILSSTGLLFLIIGYFIYSQLFNSDNTFEVPDKSIAVLAFQNMSNDPEQEYFSDGISEEILNSLARVDGLNVAGRTSSFSFKGQNADIKTIGNKLSVSMVLEGSVRKFGNRVRITAQLINVADGYHIWSKQYDRELEDIFTIQEEIATNIVNMLKLTVLIPKEPNQPTDNMLAYDYYLKGKYYISRDLEGTQKAMEFFQKAIDLDPEFALAYAGKGDAYLNYAAYGLISGNEGHLEARKAVLKSISLDDKQAYGHLVLAIIYLFYDWSWEAAESEYLKAVELGLPNPDYFIIMYESLLFENHDKAINYSKKIVKRNPLSLEAHMNLGVCYLVNDQYENAIASFNHTLKLDSNFSEGYRLLGKTYRIMGRYDESLIELNKTLEITDGKGPALYETIITLAHSGKMEEANIKLKELFKLNEGQYISPGVLAGIYANIGQTDEAFRLLEKCFEEKNTILVTLKILTRFDLIKHDPRYKNIIERMNFPENTVSLKNAN